MKKEYQKIIEYLKFDQDMSDEFIIERCLKAMYLSTIMNEKDQKTLIDIFQKYDKATAQETSWKN